MPKPTPVRTEHPRRARPDRERLTALEAAAHVPRQPSGVVLSLHVLIVRRSRRPGQHRLNPAHETGGRENPDWERGQVELHQKNRGWLGPARLRELPRELRAGSPRAARAVALLVVIEALTVEPCVVLVGVHRSPLFVPDGVDTLGALAAGVARSMCAARPAAAEAHRQRTEMTWPPACDHSIMPGFQPGRSWGGIGRPSVWILRGSQLEG